MYYQFNFSFFLIYANRLKLEFYLSIHYYIVIFLIEPSDEAMLERALAMSMEDGSAPTATPTAPATQRIPVDFANMTEDEQIAFAMQMSMQDARKY